MLRDVPPYGPEADDDIFMNGVSGIEFEHNNQAESLDDVFGSAPASPILTGDDAAQRGEPTGRAAALDHSDIPRLRSTHITSGYREGIAVSKEKHMQDGFDEGYTVGAELGLRAGRYLGILEGIFNAVRARKVNSSREVGGDTAAHRLEEVSQMLNIAEEDLKLQTLFGSEYFGPDGIWLYDVPAKGADGENEATFEEVAEAHPMIKKWNHSILQLAGKLGLALG